MPAILPGDIAQPIRGGALRVVENMEASLTVPTATSMRSIPVRTLEENRRILNKHRDATAASKISFTHLVAWAIIRALDTFPRLNDAYAELEGQAHRIQRDQVRLGIAVDVQKKDGSRTLLVPNIKDAGRMDFAQFVKAFDELVSRARKGTISPDDFMGTTVSLTNPGTVGTSASAPRLMPGQGLIVATGALDYPPEYRSMAPRTLSLLGISKVMTVTSTYDHRIIQGAESGLFLARMEELLRGEDSFYERIFEDLKVPHRPIKWEIDENPGLFGPAGSKEEIEKQARVLQLINAYRVRGHLVADLDPLDSTRAPHKDLDPATYGLTIWDLDREFITNGLAGTDRLTLREILEILRDTYCATIGVEYMFIADRERKAWLQVRMESCRNRMPLDTAARRRILEKLVEAESFERFLHTKYVGHKRFSLEGLRVHDPAPRPRALRRRALGRARGGDGHGPPRPPERPRQHGGQAAGPDLLGVRGRRGSAERPGLGRREVPPRRHRRARVRHRRERWPSRWPRTRAISNGWIRWSRAWCARSRTPSATSSARTVMPILLHGDAAFAGQGIVAETLNLSGLEGYATGGTVHVVINNQIGFTTSPTEARSSTYATDVAKMVQAPIFHVNGDDPEAVWHVAALSFEYQQRYKRDVVIDMFGYRRWGHNETDEPSYTQPLMYAKIKNHTSVAQLYGEHLVRTGVHHARGAGPALDGQEGPDAARRGGRLAGPDRAARARHSVRRSTRPRCGDGCASRSRP